MAEIRYQDRLNKLYQKDCRDMSELPDESVHMVCTSPPYWGLRRYSGVPDLVFDGKDDCEHKWVDATYKHRSSDGLQGLSKERYNEATYEALRRDKPIENAFCLKCNAWRGQLGQEPTPELYIKHIVDIFKEVKRVLRSDGVCFINIGDSYISNPGDRAKVGGFQANPSQSRLEAESAMAFNKHKSGYKPQDKCLIPFRLAIALQSDGWWIRQDIIWQKNNPMPESVSSPRWVKHRIKVKKSQRYKGDKWEGTKSSQAPQGQQPFTSSATRNLRSVWTFSTQSYAGAHYATFPEFLPMQCIKAGTSEYGCCSECGKPYARILKQNTTDTRPGLNVGKAKSGTDDDPNQALHQSELSQFRQEISYQTLGWRATCKCKTDKVIPATVLDPFCGTGTTLYVASKLGRRSIGYELSEDYCKLTIERLKQQVMM